MHTALILASTPTNMAEYQAQFIVSALFCFILFELCMTIPKLRERLFRSWRPGWLEHLIVAVWFAFMAGYGVTKGILPSVGDRLGNWILSRNGQLIGDESGVVAEHAQAAAIAAYEAETGGIIAAVSNGLQEASARFTSLTNALTTNNVGVFYVVQDAPRDLPGYISNHNLAVTQERMAMTGTNVLSVWFRYSWEVSTNAYITVRCYVNSNTFYDLTSTTNTFPNTETVTHSDGISVQCYRYEFDTSELHLTEAPMAVIPPYEATFGGTDGAPFEIPGVGLEVIGLVTGEGSVTTNTGFSGWINAWPGDWGTNLQIKCKGGVVVEALWHGTNITGEVSL